MTEIVYPYHELYPSSGTYPTGLPLSAFAVGSSWTAAIEPVHVTGVVEAAHTTGAVEPHYSTGAIEPVYVTGIVETAHNTGVLEVALT